MLPSLFNKTSYAIKIKKQKFALLLHLVGGASMKIRFAIAAFLLIAVTPAYAIPLTPGGAAAIARVIGPCEDACVVQSNSGGSIAYFEDAATVIRRARKKLVIDGYCASACMVMADRARPRTCITERAVFAYHKTNYNRPIPLRSDLHRWIMRQGGYPGFRGTPGIMPNHVAQRFFPRCKSTEPTTFANL